MKSLKITDSKLLRSIIVAQSAVLLVALANAVNIDFGILRPIIMTGYLSFIPGLAIILALGMNSKSLPVTVVYSIGLSFVFLMVVGVVLSLGLPLLGIPRPLSVIPVTLTVSTLVLAICFYASKGRGDSSTLDIQVSDERMPLYILFSLIPLSSILGILLLNSTGNNSVLLVVISVVAILPLLSLRCNLTTNERTMAVWSSSLALVYHTSLWFQSLPIGPRIAAAVVEIGRWGPNMGGRHFGASAVLPNGVLFPIYSNMSGISIVTQLEVINPFFVSLLPVALFQVYRRQIGEKEAVLAASIFMFSFPFYTLYTGMGRVATPVFFLALIGLAATDETLSSIPRALLTLLFAVGLSVSHYGTSYVVLFALIFAYGLYFLATQLDKRVEGFDLDLQMPRTLTSSYVGYFVVVVIGWYIFTAHGTKFGLLVTHVLKAVGSVFNPSLIGSGAARLQATYSSFSITFSKYIFILFGALIGIGVASTGIRRLHSPDSVSISDEFLLIAVSFLAILGSSFVNAGSSSFNMARVMMIVFVFTLPFVIIGGSAVIKFTRKLRGYSKISLSVFELGRFTPVPTRETVNHSLAIVLAVFLLLNTGVTAALVTDERAPSNTLVAEDLSDNKKLQERLSAPSCIECEIDTFLWLHYHKNGNSRVYGDDSALAKAEWIQLMLEVRTSEQLPLERFIIRPLDITSIKDTPKAGYVLLHTENVGEQVVAVRSRYEYQNLSEYEATLSNSSRIYTTGKTTVYRTYQNNSD